MHGGFPCLTREMPALMRLGARAARTDGLLERAGGRLLAHGMAGLLAAGLGLSMRFSLVSRKRNRKALEFFRENFEIRDPDAPGGMRYYQGKLLVRTDRAGDDMNVYLRFCPEPQALFRRGRLGALQRRLFGTSLDSSAIVVTEVVSERQADALQRDPEKVDMVISFKDVKTIVSLVGRGEVDIGELLLQNVVRMKGNVGHLFKFGAIAKNIELALGLG